MKKFCVIMSVILGIITCNFCSAAEIVAQENILKNADFSAKTANWRLSIAPAFKKLGATSKVEDGKFIQFNPKAKDIKAWSSYLAQTIALEKDATYTFSFDIEVEQAGSLMITYQKMKAPYTSLGLRKYLKLKQGKNVVKETFTCTETSNNAAIRIQPALLSGKVVVSNIKLVK